MTYGCVSPANNCVFFKKMPEPTTAAIPIKYADGAIQLWCGKKVPEIRPIIVNLAEQGMKVVSIIVILRSFSLSIVLVDMIPGTPQPVEISNGIKDLPERLKR